MTSRDPGLPLDMVRLCGGVFVLAALVILPAPLLPPLGLAGAVQSALGLGWKAAYLISAVGLHVVLYGSIGVAAALASGPGATRRQRLMRLFLVPLAVVALAVGIRSIKLGHVPMLTNAVIPMGACALGAVIGLLFRQRGWRVAIVVMLLALAGLAWSFFPGAPSTLRGATEAHLRALLAAAPHLPSGEERFGAIVQAAFASDPAAADPVEDNRGAILALGIAVGHER